ncbi:MAG: hypothetical protein ACP5VQ_09060, partial [Phycisphaerae bacterium]
MPDRKNISVRPGTRHPVSLYAGHNLRRESPVAIAVNSPETLRDLIGVLIHRLVTVRDQAALAARNPDADAIHDARVASRRAAAVLGILVTGGILQRSDAGAIKNMLRKMR